MKKILNIIGIVSFTLALLLNASTLINKDSKTREMIINSFTPKNANADVNGCAYAGNFFPDHQIPTYETCFPKGDVGEACALATACGYAWFASSPCQEIICNY